jgi:hypothetical protein
MDWDVLKGLEDGEDLSMKTNGGESLEKGRFGE